MVPKMKNHKQVKRYDKIGLWHYLLNFDAAGRLTMNKDVVIDFETMGKHLIALDDAARKNGMTISKVILKIDLKDEFYNTKSGKEVKRRGIYLARNLSETLNKVHDDHYHVDFRIIN
jgi:penicillin-insensitive murein endopeptidase